MIFIVFNSKRSRTDIEKVHYGLILCVCVFGNYVDKKKKKKNVKRFHLNDSSLFFYLYDEKCEATSRFTLNPHFIHSSYNTFNKRRTKIIS